MSNQEKILSLQGLRALAFIGIFTEHAGLTHLGSWGVSCFFVLSGFFMYYNYGGVFQECNSVKNNIIFGIKRVGKLYPLHCITFIIALIVYWDNQRLDSARHILIWMFKALANLLLLQSWFPKAEFYFSFNAVSWYLSTALALYFAFPYMRKVVNKIKTRKGILIQFVTVLVIQSVISILLLVFNNQIENVPVVISDDLTKYVTYICPLYRMGDFYIGCILGFCFINSSFDMVENKIICNMIEILSFVSIGGLQLIYNGQWGVLGTDAFKYTLLYICDVILLVYFIGRKRGILSKCVLSSRLIVCVGNLSGYAFLIHQLVIVLVKRAFKAYIEWPVRMAILSFAITMVFAYIIMILERKIQGKIKANYNIIY